MPKGYRPSYLYDNVNIDKPIEVVWEIIQQYSNEVFPDEFESMFGGVNFLVLIPPLKYEGKFLKGLCMTNGADCFHEKFPNFKDLFISMQYTMWASIPWSKYAEVYLTCYKNSKREDWFMRTYPETAEKIFFPKQDADFLNEKFFSPVDGVEKDIDVLCVSRLNEVKNLPLLVEALIIYEKKYGKRLKSVLITGQRQEDFAVKEIDVVEKMAQKAGGLERLKEYIDFVDFVQYGFELNKYYSRAKCTVLTSIYEGKNRVINESMSCNTPLVLFKDLCKYTIGEEDSALLPNSGVFAEQFNADSLADSIHYMMEHYTEFSPRENYLKFSGRMNFMNDCVASIPYYRESIPDFVSGRLQDNEWLNNALQENYGIRFENFVYGTNFLRVDERFSGLLQYYSDKINV